MKRFLFLLLTVVSLSASAQDVAPVLKFGYLSYDEVLQSLPEYVTIEAGMAELQEQYAAEQKRVEDEFNQKYEDFLEGQHNFPSTILQKRQNELQELLDKNIAFKKESQRLLAEAKEKALAPLKQRLADALARVGSARDFAFILNTDQNVAPWINTDMGVDVTEAVKIAMQ